MILLTLLILIDGDFPINTAYEDQYKSYALFAHDYYYVFWQDMRYYSPDRSIFAARVTTDGTVLDPEGRLIMRDRTAEAVVAYDGFNFLVVVEDSC